MECHFRQGVIWRNAFNKMQPILKAFPLCLSQNPDIDITGGVIVLVESNILMFFFLFFNKSSCYGIPNGEQYSRLQSFLPIRRTNGRLQLLLWPIGLFQLTSRGHWSSTRRISSLCSIPTPWEHRDQSPQLRWSERHKQDSKSPWTPSVNVFTKWVTGDSPATVL